jgi:hypothetical protein
VVSFLPAFSPKPSTIHNSHFIFNTTIPRQPLSYVREKLRGWQDQKVLWEMGVLGAPRPLLALITSQLARSSLPKNKETHDNISHKIRV